MPAAALVQRAVQASVLRLAAHDDGARTGADVEDVHQARVATRRLRSDLRTFAPVLDRDAVRPVVDELRWLGGCLGAVRDTDVLLLRFEAAASQLTEDDQPAARRAFTALHRQAEAGRRELVAALDSERYTALSGALDNLAHDLPVTEDASLDAAEIVPGLVRRPWKRLEAAVDALAPEPPDEALHEVRILAKRTRYAAEAAIPVFGKQAARFAEGVEAVQEVLGQHQDAVVAEAWLRQSAGGLDVPTALAAGQLIAMQRHDAAARRREWPGTWKAAAPRKHRKWLYDAVKKQPKKSEKGDEA